VNPLKIKDKLKLMKEIKQRNEQHLKDFKKKQKKKPKK